MNYFKKNFKNTYLLLDTVRYFWLFSMFTTILLMSNYAFASGGGTDDFAYRFCLLAQLVKGPIGTGLATIAIATLAGSFLFGKIDVKTLLIVASGVLGIFFAPNIVNTITGNTSYSNCSST